MSPIPFSQESAVSERTPVEQVPAVLNSSSSKLVYLYLAAVGEATIDDLQATLDIPQLTLFPTLRTLENQDLIKRSGETFALTA